MEIARLVLDYCTVLVWPALVATVLFVFRARLTSMLPALSGITAGGVSATFDATAAQALAVGNAGSETPIRLGAGGG